MKSSSKKNMPLWAAAGLVFIINSLVFYKFLDDDGFLASVSAGIAVIILLFPMVSILIEDLRNKQMKMHELVILAVIASCIQGDLITSSCRSMYKQLNLNFLKIFYILEKKFHGIY